MKSTIYYLITLMTFFMFANGINASSILEIDTVFVNNTNGKMFKYNSKIAPGEPGYATLKKSAPDKYYMVSQGNDQAVIYSGRLLNGKRHGDWLHYIGGKKIISSEKYLNGVLHGYSIFYDPITEEAIKMVEYLHGKLHGGANLWYSSGQMLKEYQYSYDLEHGLFITYYENGQIKQQGQYYQGKGLHKICSSFYESGKMKNTCKYFQGEKNGTFKEYGENGKLLKETDYLYGVLSGKEVFYDKSGAPVYTITYHKGKQIKTDGTPPSK